MNNFLFNLREIKEKNGISYRAWAKHSGLSEATIRNTLNGRHKNVTIHSVLKLAESVGLDIQELFKKDAHKKATMAFCEPETRSYQHKGGNAELPTPKDAGVALRAYRLLEKELEERKRKESEEQIEIWALQIADDFARTGYATLTPNFIRSFLDQQEMS